VHEYQDVREQLRLLLDSRTGAWEEPVRRNHHNHERQVIDMARPETVEDILAEQIEFATIQLDKISGEPALLKGYTQFIEAAVKAGAVVDSSYYGGVKLSRAPRPRELAEQLQGKQAAWDEGKKQYEIKRDIGECEYSYMESMAQRWAEQEELPFPPKHEPINSFDAVISAITEEVGA